MKRTLFLAIATVIVTAAVGCGDDDDRGPQQPAAFDPADFSTTIDNPLFPLSSYREMIYEGVETEPETGETVETRVVMTVQPETRTVAGVAVLVVKDEAYEDGELVELTLDYFAQHSDGSVYYFGEDVDNYKDGELQDHDGSWLAGGDNQPGIIMPPAPAVGDVFQQEKAPGIAEDEMTVLSVTETVDVPAGSFVDCVRTEDVNPLDQKGHVEYKYYCPHVGLTKEEFAEGALVLVSYD